MKPETSNKTSDRAFAVAAATTWNQLPQKVSGYTTTEQFSRVSKIHPFKPRLIAWLTSGGGASDYSLNR